MQKEDLSGEGGFKYLTSDRFLETKWISSNSGY